MRAFCPPTNERAKRTHWSADERVLPEQNRETTLLDIKSDQILKMFEFGSSQLLIDILQTSPV
jgi:hypothetical protein